MTLNPAQRRKLHWLCLLTPGMTAAGAMSGSALGFPHVLEKHLPHGLSSYVIFAMDAAPIGWGILTAACSFGLALGQYREFALTSWKPAIWLIILTPCIFIAHLIFTFLVIFPLVVFIFQVELAN